MSSMTARQAGTRTKARHNRHRVAASLASAMLVAIGATAVGASPAAAGECTTKSILSHDFTFCGKAANASGYAMHTASLSAGRDWCDVWNKNGGIWRSWQHMSCTQSELPKYSFFSRQKDVDAITFNYRDYYVWMPGFGTFQKRTKGVWTKIHDDQVAACIGTGFVPLCVVLP